MEPLFTNITVDIFPLNYTSSTIEEKVIGRYGFKVLLAQRTYIFVSILICKYAR